MATEKTEVEKAVAALEAALRKCARAGLAVNATYSVINKDGSVSSYRSNGND